MVRCDGLRCYLAGFLVVYSCGILLAKKQRREETYGDLGDEIITDRPTHTNRKDFIPRPVPESSHKIEPKSKRNYVGHYVNPLFYREFQSAPPNRRQQVRRPVAPVRKNARQYIPPWSRNRGIPPWSKKNTIHRPALVGRLPFLPRRTVPGVPRAKVPAAPRPRPAAQTPAQKKWYQLNASATKARINALKSRYQPKAAVPKRRVHVQVLPGRTPARTVKQMGIHRGFVLMPARQQKRQPSPPARGAVRRPKFSPSPASDRFAEKKHIFLPLNKHYKAPPPNHLAAYHLDEIGNLIPDISNPKYFEPEQNKNSLPKSASSCRIPMKRDGRCPVPAAKTFVSQRERSSYQAAKDNAARNQKRQQQQRQQQQRQQQQRQQQQLARQQQIARQMRLPARAAARKPLPAKTKPRSSQRILYFAQHGKTFPAPQDRRYQQVRKQVSPAGARARKPVVVSRTAQPQPHRTQPQSRGAASMYEVPNISNKVYNYINQRTSSRLAPNNSQKMENPLLKYIQYHRTHPSPSTQGPSVANLDTRQSNIDKRSIVTITEQ